MMSAPSKNKYNFLIPFVIVGFTLIMMGGQTKSQKPNVEFISFPSSILFMVFLALLAGSKITQGKAFLDKIEYGVMSVKKYIPYYLLFCLAYGIFNFFVVNPRAFEFEFYANLGHLGFMTLGGFLLCKRL